MTSKCKSLLLALLALGSLSANAGDVVKTSRVRKQVTKEQPAALPYQATFGRIKQPRMIRKVAANGLTADFTVQDSVSYITVWSENFDSDERDVKGNLTLAGWTIDQGEGNVVTFTKKKCDDYSAIDANDVYSLYIDGPYQTFKRTKASATSSAISVPTNGQLHAYVRMTPMWNEYVTLALQLSTDDFSTMVEVWNSKSVTEGKAQWVPITYDLAAYAGKQIKIRLYWGPGTNDTFNTGGYMGDFYVDGLSVTGVGSVDQVSVKTGDLIQFADLTTGGTPTSWEWSFPGGTPATSTEQSPTVYYTEGGTYDVTLRVTDAEGSDEVTKTAFVSVEAQAPLAGVQFPADFRTMAQPRMRMVAPLAPVEYKDASEGFPTEFSWTMYTPYDLANMSGFMFIPDTVYTTKDVTYRHNKLGKCYVLHTAQNAEGYTFVDDSVQVQFDGYVSNYQPADGYQTNFVDGDLTLPGANKMGITAWAERISKPSVPVVLEAMYIGFTKASATGLVDQISPVSFSLYTSENGLPGKPIELLDSWNVSELNYAMGANAGMVTIELGRRIVIDQEVFLVIEGIPEKNDSLECAIGMAPLRDYGNTAFMLRKGTWRPFTGYFQAAPGGQTSLSVFPYFNHSVIIPAQVDERGGITMGSDTTMVSPDAGEAEVLVFANQGVYKYLGCDADWCRIVGKPGEYTIDTVRVEVDAMPDGVEWRDAVISVTDSVQTLNLVVRQSRKVPSAIQSYVATPAASLSERFDLQGRRLNAARQPRGIYLERKNGKIRKVMGQ